MDLEFDTDRVGVELLGSVTSSLVTIDDLLRDLASIVGHGADAEFRKIDIVAIDLKTPLKIRLALFGISDHAVAVFEGICRNVIRNRDPQVPELSGLSDAEVSRLHAHARALQSAAVSLKRVRVTES